MYDLIYIVLIDFWQLFNFFFYICLNGFDNLIADFYILAIEKSIFFQIILIFFKNIIINMLFQVIHKKLSCINLYIVYDTTVTIYVIISIFPVSNKPALRFRRCIHNKNRKIFSQQCMNFTNNLLMIFITVTGLSPASVIQLRWTHNMKKAVDHK